MNLIEENSIPEPNSGCWLWLGPVMTCGMGYGRVTIAPRTRVLAHRHSYLVYKAPPPADLDVCHKCDVPICVNPDHLFLGTRGENMDDMWAKGRAVCWNNLKTHCKHGHELAGDNVYWRGKWRQCRECQRIATRRWKGNHNVE